MTRDSAAKIFRYSRAHMSRDITGDTTEKVQQPIPEIVQQQPLPEIVQQTLAEIL